MAARVPAPFVPRTSTRWKGLHLYRGRKGETKAFTWSEYRDLLIAAHRQLPGGVIVLIWDNLNVHLRAELRAFTAAQAWLRVFQLPSCPGPQPGGRDLVRAQARRPGQPRRRQLRPPGPGHPARPEENPVPAPAYRRLPHRNQAEPGARLDGHQELKICNTRRNQGIRPRNC